MSTKMNWTIITLCIFFTLALGSTVSGVEEYDLPEGTHPACGRQWKEGCLRAVIVEQGLCTQTIKEENSYFFCIQVETKTGILQLYLKPVTTEPVQSDFCTLSCSKNYTCSEIEFRISDTNINEIYDCILHQVISNTVGTPTTKPDDDNDDENQQPELEDDDDEETREEYLHIILAAIFFAVMFVFSLIGYLIWKCKPSCCCSTGKKVEKLQYEETRL